MEPSGPPGPRAPTSLSEPCLVLNRSWVPINTTTVRHAITLVVKEAAMVIEPETYQLNSFESWAEYEPREGDPVIHSVHSVVRVPEIIVLAHYDRIPRKEVPFTRRNLYRRDDQRCQYCGTRKGGDALSIDHVIPRSKGGSTSWENCVLACVKCNIRKGDRLPWEHDIKPMRTPRRPEWSPCLGIRRVKRKPSWKRFISNKHWAMDIDD